MRNFLKVTVRFRDSTFQGLANPLRLLSLGTEKPGTREQSGWRRLHGKRTPPPPKGCTPPLHFAPCVEDLGGRTQNFGWKGRCPVVL